MKSGKSGLDATISSDLCPENGRKISVNGFIFRKV